MAQVKRYIEIAVVLIVLLAYGWAAYQRNFVWKDAFSLWTDVVKKSPFKARGYNEIGLWYYERHMIENAIPYFEKSIGLGTNAKAYNNLGLCFLGKGWNDMATEEFKKAIYIMPYEGMFHVNLGIAYLQTGQYDEANREMQLGMELRRKK